MQNILQGLRIVEGSAFIAAPMCGTTLGQLGADVIRFDQLGADWISKGGQSPKITTAFTGQK